MSTHSFEPCAQSLCRTPTVDAPAAGDWLPADAHSILLLFPDVHGNLRGKMMSRSVVTTSPAAGVSTTDLLLAVDPVDEPITTMTDFGINGGAKDLLLRPDRQTTRPVPWLPECYLTLGDLFGSDGSPCGVSPRQVLRRALSALSDQGLVIKAAFEFEFRLFKAGSWEPASTGLSYSPSTLSQVGDYVGTLHRYADALGLGLNVVHSEGAPGLIEVNVDPQEGIEAADTAALIRLAATEAARRHDLWANFMSKPVAHEEGSSAHVHFSMWDSAGTNALRHASVNADDEFYRRAAWGMLTHLPALSLIYNPTINSYKRLVPGYFAPVTAACGPDDRSFALRALLRGESSSRFELRRPGADTNPYLTLAAIAASVSLGLTSSEVPGRVIIDDYDAPLPCSLEAAIGAFDRRDVGVDEILGASFCAHYLTTRRWELHAWQNAVSDWERQRYA